MFPSLVATEAQPKAEPKAKRPRALKAEAPATPAPPAILLPRAAMPEGLEAIRLTCLEKKIDLELILAKWQVTRLEELDGPSAQQVQEWLVGQ